MYANSELLNKTQLNPFASIRHINQEHVTVTPYVFCLCLCLFVLGVKNRLQD